MTPPCREGQENVGAVNAGVACVGPILELVASMAAAGAPPRLPPEQGGELVRGLLAALGVANGRLDGRGLVVASISEPR